MSDHRLVSDHWYLAEIVNCLKNSPLLALLTSVLGLHVLYAYLWHNNLTFFAWLTKEDGLLEYGTAVLMLLAGCIFLRGALKTKSRMQKGWAIAFGAVLVFMAGEEISWGQRIFGLNWQALQEINDQDETNLHNLSFINAGRLLRLGCLFLGVVVPGILLSSRRARNLAFERLRLPLPHPIASVCFISSAIWIGTFHVAPYNSAQALSVEESSEFSIGLACFLFAALWLFSRNTQKQFQVDLPST